MSTVDVEIIIQPKGRRTPSSDTRATRAAAPAPRIPRITRLMALAIKFQDMVDQGEARDYADIARLGYVTRARLTQIMNLLLLAPDIQDNILSWSANAERFPAIAERQLRSLTQIPAWGPQRRLWLDLLSGPIAQG